MGYLHVPQNVAVYVGSLDLSPFALIFVLSLIYILLGCLLDGISMIVMTLPIVLPMVVAAGFDQIWFGVYLIVMIELAMITPPIGFNLFVIQGIAGQSIGRVAVAAIPFFVLTCLAAALLTTFTDIALWLPHVLLD